MRFRDYLILTLLLVLVIAAVVWSIRRRKAGKGCCGDCASCGKTCTKPEKKPDKR